MPIRLNNIDTPELHDKSPKVRHLAEEAKHFTEEHLHGKFSVQNLERDKYFRLRGNIIVGDKDLSELLLEKRLAKEYHGEKKPKWSEEE